MPKAYTFKVPVAMLAEGGVEPEAGDMVSLKVAGTVSQVSGANASVLIDSVNESQPGAGGGPSGSASGADGPTQTPPQIQLGQAMPAAPGINGAGANLTPEQVSQQFGIPMGANGLPQADLSGWTPPRSQDMPPPTNMPPPTMNLPQTPPQIALGQQMPVPPGNPQAAQGAAGRVPMGNMMTSTGETTTQMGARLRRLAQIESARREALGL